MAIDASDERLQCRVDVTTKGLLKRAADVSNESLTSFVLRVATAEAANVLAERALLSLGPEASAVFSAALERPPKVNERLRAALDDLDQAEWLA